jgi:SAM-dependent methyltransferase
MPIGTPDPGKNTATPTNITYRVGRIAPYLSGRWLDYGCADGGYASALLNNGATSVVGVDILENRINSATARQLSNAAFYAFDGSRLDFKDESFDGAFVNEVLEHVADEHESLLEIHRVLQPGGLLVVMSPNRWFPVDGHCVTIGGVRFGPAPLIPWLPVRLTRKWTDARNYWPHQLISLVRNAGFVIKETGFIWPVFDQYPWLPAPIIPIYLRWINRIDDIPGLRRFGLSTLIIAIKPGE